MQQIYHKKNELFEFEFYQNKECTEDFDFTNAENLYIELKDGDVTPFLEIYKYTEFRKLFIPYIPNIDSLDFLPTFENIFTLDEITPDLSKYIPEDNAVLFLSEEDERQYGEIFQDVNSYYTYPKIECEIEGYSMPRDYNKATIFLPHGIQTELQKANEVEKELKEKYGVEEVNLFALHCFVEFENLSFGAIKLAISREYDIDNFNFNKIITTNSTGILKPQNSERLQVIDCKEIFEEYLKTER